MHNICSFFLFSGNVYSGQYINRPGEKSDILCRNPSSKSAIVYAAELVSEDKSHGNLK